MDATRAVLEKVKAITADPANVGAALKLGACDAFVTLVTAEIEPVLRAAQVSRRCCLPPFWNPIWMQIF